MLGRRRRHGFHVSRPAAGSQLETFHLYRADCHRFLPETDRDQNKVFRRGKRRARQSKIAIVVPPAPRPQVDGKRPARQAIVSTPSQCQEAERKFSEATR